ncbi:hypothetical protein [Rhizobium sp. BK176]|uniref:hypothetical protein n=1 Tax=Rhizobium sp. BK176 TaxID=2587071 RepID=UPI00216727A9|nr:hypothetical protein [Rhizobium sp. BK176]MCS4089180.1 hypothetical protein [Rhizobium sp. BK176]
MNVAAKAVLRWLLSRRSDQAGEIELFISALERGVDKKEGDAVELLAGLLNRPNQEAKEDDDQADIERLIALHLKLEEPSKQEQVVVAMQEIRGPLDLPPSSGLQARVRSWGLETQPRNIVAING